MQLCLANCCQQKHAALGTGHISLLSAGQPIPIAAYRETAGKVRGMKTTALQLAQPCASKLISELLLPSHVLPSLLLELCS